ncbi:hypothetical protein Q6348_00055 [Isoptericola sp. b441]|uniref:General stress protein 17M-like domain-containing protein n=1 Tax=Actinotalea lenta TaxID=3064654 RepID=A0ABT9D4J4_9CELL|nr:MULTISPECIES: general stress protein [unclassified Isoptericola]MDO8105587.1 hypothetical protein [Isoptericola sp. b441]MDO8122707.1 hypothetical protein [Isoptericola sp. b490]
MAFSSGRIPRVPTLPHGEQIASYSTYLEAQRAVDHLSDKEFPVQLVTIVGTDLRMVERITGRVTYARVALAGLMSGAWFGLAVGVLLSLFASSGQQALPIPAAMAIGAAFGILFSVISHAFSGGRRDFTSASQIVAGSYAVLCAAEEANRARGLLTAEGGPGLGRVQPTVGRPSQPFGASPSQPGYQPPQQSHQPPHPPAEHPTPPTQPPANPHS